MSSASFAHGGYPPLPSAIPDPSLDDSYEIVYEDYSGEHLLPEIVSLIEKELSEPYIIYTYRYFLLEWPHLCSLAFARKRNAKPNENAERSPVIGVIVSKLDRHNKGSRLMRGYIAMLSVHTAWRGRGIAKALAKANVAKMVALGAEEVVLETEVDNEAALSLYGRLDFIREKRLFHFYLNGKDAFRLVYSPPRREEAVVKDSHTLPEETAAHRLGEVV